MTPLDDLLDRARAAPRHIVLAEGDDPRIVKGALKAASEGLAQITLLKSHTGDQTLLDAPHDISGVPVQFIDPANFERREQFAQSYFQLRQHKGVTLEQAREIIARPLEFAAMMVREGLADGSLAGAVHTTGDTVRAAIQVIGLAPRSKLVSSFFMMMLPAPLENSNNVLFFADCAMVVDPDANQLAQIAIASADSVRSLLGIAPLVAMLSFSTNGSAKHPFVDKVREATKIVQRERPDLLVEGEMQFDAALIKKVSAIKAPHSKIKGRANVLVFPSLEAGNIGYKIAERIGQAQAIGPILQGLAKPANDLSRGCSAEDVYRMIAVTVAQAQGNEAPDQPV